MTDAGQSLRTLQEQAFLLDSLAEGDPPRLEFGAESLSVAYRTLQEMGRGGGGLRE